MITIRVPDKYLDLVHYKWAKVQITFFFCQNSLLPIKQVYNKIVDDPILLKKDSTTTKNVRF